MVFSFTLVTILLKSHVSQYMFFMQNPSIVNMVICSYTQRTCFLPGNSCILFDEIVLWHNHMLIKSSIYSSMFSCCHLQDVLSISVQPQCNGSSLFPLHPIRAVIHNLNSPSSFSCAGLPALNKHSIF